MRPTNWENIAPFTSAVAHQLMPCQAEDYEVSMAVHQVDHEANELEEQVKDYDKDADTSMATHKLPELEPESMFLSLPASLASHLVLPVEWPETGLLTSMVAHQVYQPCQENLEESVPVGAHSLQETKEATFEEDLRENLKELLMGIDFKATYGNFEEDFSETKLAEDSTENIAMDYEVAIVEEELVEEVGKEADNKNITHKVPEVEGVEANDADTTSMATHKLPEMEPESTFLSLPASLASHLVLPVEWPETGL